MIQQQGGQRSIASYPTVMLPDMSPIFAAMSVGQGRQAGGAQRATAGSASQVKALPGAFAEYEMAKSNISDMRKSYIEDLTRRFGKSGEDPQTFLNNNMDEIQRRSKELEFTQTQVDSYLGIMENDFKRYQELSDDPNFHEQYLSRTGIRGLEVYGQYKNPEEMGSVVGWGKPDEVFYPMKGNQWLEAMALPNVATMTGISAPAVYDQDKYIDDLESQLENYYKTTISETRGGQSLAESWKGNIKALYSFVADAAERITPTQMQGLINTAYSKYGVNMLDADNNLIGFGVAATNVIPEVDASGNQTGNVALEQVVDEYGNPVIYNLSTQHEMAAREVLKREAYVRALGRESVHTSAIHRAPVAGTGKDEGIGFYTSLHGGSLLQQDFGLTRDMVISGKFRDFDLGDALRKAEHQVLEENRINEFSEVYSQVAKEMEKNSTFNALRSSEQEGDAEKAREMLLKEFEKQLTRQGVLDDAIQNPVQEYFAGLPDWIKETLSLSAGMGAAGAIMPGVGAVAMGAAFLKYENRVRWNNMFSNLTGLQVYGDKGEVSGIIRNNFDIMDRIMMTLDSYPTTAIEVDNDNVNAAQNYYRGTINASRAISWLYDQSLSEIIGDDEMPMMIQGQAYTTLPFRGDHGQREYGTGIKAHIFLTKEQADKLQLQIFTRGGDNFEPVNATSKKFKDESLYKKVEVVNSDGEVLYKANYTDPALNNQFEAKLKQMWLEAGRSRKLELYIFEAGVETSPYMDEYSKSKGADEVKVFQQVLGVAEQNAWYQTLQLNAALGQSVEKKED